VLTSVGAKIRAFWDVALCCLVGWWPAKENELKSLQTFHKSGARIMGCVRCENVNKTPL
jgi:hypothetical protein